MKNQAEELLIQNLMVANSIPDEAFPHECVRRRERMPLMPLERLPVVTWKLEQHIKNNAKG